MGKRKTPLELGRRERQLVETVVKLGEASVADVRTHLVDPPSYSAVRAMLVTLVEKKWLKYRRDGKRYLYRPAAGKQQTQKRAISRLLDTFFAGSPTDALAALLDSSVKDMTDEEYQRMQDMIKRARKENR